MKGMLRPLGDKLVVERVQADSKTPGGIVLPDTAKEKPQRGVVKFVGTGKLLENGDRARMQVAEGNHVIFTSYAGNEVRINDTEYVILNESDVLAIIE